MVKRVGRKFAVGGTKHGAAGARLAVDRRAPRRIRHGGATSANHLVSAD